MARDVEVHVVRIIRPARGKIHKVNDLVRDLVTTVEDQAPDVLKYQFLISQEGIIITQELYKSAKAAMNHLLSSYYFEFLERLNDGNLLAKEIETQVMMPFVGFESRT